MLYLALERKVKSLIVKIWKTIELKNHKDKAVNGETSGQSKRERSPLQAINNDEGNRQKWDESLPPPNKNQKGGTMSKHKESENETSASETSEINGIENPSQKRTNKLSLAKNGKKSKNQKW